MTECIHKLVKTHWARDSYLCLSLYASDKSLLELCFLSYSFNLPCPWPSGKFSIMPKKHKTCSSWRGSWVQEQLQRHATDTCLYDFGLSRSLNPLRPRRQATETEMFFFMPSLGPSVKALQHSADWPTSLQYSASSKTVAEGHLGKHFKGRMPDTPSSKLSYPNRYSHTSSAGVAIP